MVQGIMDVKKGFELQGDTPVKVSWMNILGKENRVLTFQLYNKQPKIQVSSYNGSLCQRSQLMVAFAIAFGPRLNIMWNVWQNRPTYSWSISKETGTPNPGITHH